MNRQKIKILIAEDNKELCEGFKMSLEEAGYKVIPASDGEVAIQNIEKKKFDVVLLDMEMPKKDGIAVLKVIEDKLPQAKVLIITAYLNKYGDEIRKHKVVSACYSKPVEGRITNLVYEMINNLRIQVIQKDILLGDNNEEFCYKNRLNLKNKGHRVFTASNADEAIDLLKHRLFDIIFLDTLEYRKRECTGMRVLDFTKDFFPSNRIIGSKRYTELYSQDILSQYPIIGYYDSLGTDETVIAWIEKEAVRKQERFKFQSARQEIEVIDPFGVPLDFVDQLDFTSYEVLMKGLYELLKKRYSRKAIDSMFQLYHTQNLILCDHEVVSIKGLLDEEIREIEQKRKKICYVFSKTEWVEDVGISDWNPAPSPSTELVREIEIERGQWHSAYPTLSLFLEGKDGKEIPVEADFDTGNPYLLCFNKELLKDLPNEEKFPIRREGSHLSKYYYYYLKPVKIGINDINGNKASSEFLVRFVLAWENSPFRRIVSPEREAFVGRALWTGMDFSIKMNSNTRKSSIQLKELQPIKEDMKDIIATIENNDLYKKGHSEMVAKYSKEMAKELGQFSEEEIEIIELAALLHDIGMIYIRNKVLVAQRELTEIEMNEVRLHSLKGANMLKPHSLKELVLYVKYHHERYNGSGYPDNLKGDKIPRGAQIIAVADVFNAMISPRSHRPAKNESEAIKELENKDLFNQSIVEAFLKIKDKVSK